LWQNPGELRSVESLLAEIAPRLASSLDFRINLIQREPIQPELRGTLPRPAQAFGNGSRRDRANTDGFPISNRPS